MKKILKVIIIALVLFIGTNKVMAQSPKDDGYIKVNVKQSSGTEETYIYSSRDAIGSISGISYDKSTNTLTFNNFVSKDYIWIEIYDMGDLNINVIGTNVITTGKISTDEEGNTEYEGNTSDESIKITGNNSTTISGGGSIQFSGYIGVYSEDGTLSINNVKLSNEVNGNSYLISTEGDLNINNSSLNFNFYDSSYSTGILSESNITIKDSNISGTAGNGIIAQDDYENGNIKIEGSTIDLNITYYAAVGIGTSNLDIKNSTIKIKNGGILGANNTDITSSNIDIKYEVEKEDDALGILGLSLNLNDSNINVDLGESEEGSCIGAAEEFVIAEELVINGGKLNLKAINGYGVYHKNMLIKKGTVNITALNGIYSEEEESTFTIENGKLVINALMGITTGNANFNGGYTMIDTSNKDKLFNEEAMKATVLAMGNGINVGNNMEISNNGKVYKLSLDEDFAMYYINDEEVTYDEETTFSKPLINNVIIKDKNYKEEEQQISQSNSNNNDVENPKTSDISIVFMIFIFLSAVLCSVKGIKRLKKITNK